jgi:hypothetical protein
MVCLKNISADTLHKGDTEDDDDDDDISHIGNCKHTTESANVKVQNIFHGWNNSTCSTNCKYRTAATLYTLEIWFVSGI